MKKYNSNNVDYFCFELDGKEYKMPLITSLTISELEEMSTTDGDDDNAVKWHIDYLRKHVGAKVVDKLPAGVVNDILTDWGKESAKDGATVGESSAS